MAGMMPLTIVSEGEECKVLSIRKTKTAPRLREMGFVDTAPLKVLSCNSTGVIVDLNGVRLALCRELASQIMVSC